MGWSNQLDNLVHLTCPINTESYSESTCPATEIDVSNWDFDKDELLICLFSCHQTCARVMFIQLAGGLRSAVVHLSGQLLLL